MRKRIVWITGARGFIGRYVARACMARGDIVAGLGHGSWRAVEAKSWGVTTWLNGDITSSNLARLADATGLPDVVVHLAGGSSVGVAIDQPREDFFRTVSSTIELLDWCRLSSPETRIAGVSSAAVYGSGHAGLIAETAHLKPFSPYGHHKLMMESLCRSYAETYGLRAVIARLFSVYGDGLTKQLLWDMCTKLEAGAQELTLGGTGAELRDWVHVDDVAVVLASIDSQASEDVPVFNVASGGATSVASVAESLTKAWHECCGGEIAQIEFSGKSRPGDPFSLVGDVGALTNIGMRCTSDVKKGIREYVNWFSWYRKSLA